MDKDAWFRYAESVSQAFVNATPVENKKLQATFGNLLNNEYIGRKAFQNIYDHVSCWPCWDLASQELDWETKIRYELQASQMATTNNDSTTKWFVETDEHCVAVDCSTIIQSPPQVLQLDIKSCKDKLEMSHISISSINIDTTLFKIIPKATYSGAQVIKKKVFKLDTHLHWEYEFCLVWSCPFLEEPEGNGTLVFKQEPKCEIRITCEKRSDPTVETPTNWKYVAESLLLKIYDAIPPLYKSSDKACISLPPSSSMSTT